ncbi:LOW QUALITY PROTEIN: DNA cross-link repair protein SNM1 [Quercus lobata]|uniref:LOW QUALITY PROTEIN: DNA cross-link repair protein SNM1 n=1 Tax=Quercus lobata TaxID=97700 RepID=UPI0012486A3C|nr:LOW QUALITY PROTEIN: DNA cross-link repair protein SNM1 [Quercus lobata]
MISVAITGGEVVEDEQEEFETNVEPSDSDILLDDNGFPSFQLDPEPHVYQNNNASSSIRNQQESESESDSFASDFYRSGTDWSCLLLQHHDDDGDVDTITGDCNQINGHDGKTQSERKMKQANLFQMWGLKKPHLSQPPLKKMKIGNERTHFTKKTNVSANPNSRPRLCPFYKKIPGTPFTVDAFRYGHIEGCSAYFLTHFHYDHYGGLSKGWSHGPIYCTPITARLLAMCLSVNPSFICPLELNTENVIKGVRVVLLEANHCPGAALIHFRLPNGQCYLHTGDFRACKLMQTYSLLLNERVNVLFLDTTYCNPKYKFPSKEDVLSYVVRTTQNCLKRQPKTLVVVGAYSIGKESVYLAISKALGVKIYANASRRRVLHSFGWPELSGILCSHGKDTLLHVLPISSLRFETLKDYLKTYKDQYAAVLAFRPTGWTYSETIGNQLDLIKPSSKGNVTIFGVPYSEHSSFTELREFVQLLRPDKIIPTVNVGNATNRDKMHSCFREWLKG